MSGKNTDAEAVVIKKYANRRLYDTQTSVYITLSDVRAMVKKGREFVVRDAKTGEDLTRQILTQIIFEQELTGQSLMPIGFLKRVIEMHDDRLSELVPHYLEKSMEAFVANQDNIRKYMGKSWGQYNPLNQFEEISRQNVELVSKAFQNMFNPFETYFKQDEEKPRKPAGK
jgi:polyhydroxyalkanoate synthesis repressor PhaR